MEYQYAEWLEAIENGLWGYVGVPVIMALGLYLGYASRWVQLRCFPEICRNFFSSLFAHTQAAHGLPPMRAFFASIGGSLGIGNVVAVATAITIGGPGTLVWLWATAIVGSLIKYAEVFIGMTHRRYLPDGSTRGGPMFFLRDAFASSWPASLFCVGMCLYSVEIYQFGVVSNVTAQACGVSVWITALIFLAIIISVEKGGFQRVGKVASILIPCTVVVYVCMGTYVLFVNYQVLPSVIADILASSCSLRAAEGGFIGSTCMMALSHGVRRGCYSSDLGIGYASIIHSASTATNPLRQARLLIFEVFVDTFFVCTMSVMLVLVTGVWKEPIDSLVLIQSALGKYFPYMDIFVPFFIALLGYSAITTYFSSGMHTIAQLLPKWGRSILYVYAISAFLTFAFVESRQACSVMAIVGCSLLLINAAGIWRLRHTIQYETDEGT